MRNETGARAKNQLNDDPGAISVDCELSFSIAHFEVGETAIAKKKSAAKSVLGWVCPTFELNFFPFFFVLFGVSVRFA